MELEFNNFKEISQSVDRCVGYTKSGKKCRTRLRKNQYLFCCEDHKPYNKEILVDGCFCCTDKIINHKDAILFKCKHLVHKSCYLDWAKGESNTYENPICIICRKSVFNENHKKKIKSLPYENKDEDKDLNKVLKILEVQILEDKIHDHLFNQNVNKFKFSDSIIILDN